MGAIWVISGEQEGFFRAVFGGESGLLLWWKRFAPGGRNEVLLVPRPGELGGASLGSKSLRRFLRVSPFIINA